MTLRIELEREDDGRWLAEVPALAGLVREALARELARLRKAHHKGKPWPPRAAPLVGGRPVSR